MSDLLGNKDSKQHQVMRDYDSINCTVLKKSITRLWLAKKNKVLSIVFMHVDQNQQIVQINI